MPKIEVYRHTLFSFIGKALDMAALEELLPAAKAELDGYDETEGILKIELNDTNRPDLWSTAGLGRQLRVFTGGQRPEYAFFSEEDRTLESGGRFIEVDPELKDIRPYVAAFAVTGKAIGEPALKDIIQTQEKLCWNFGQKRSSIAMGVYRSGLITYPVRYIAADPDATTFIPLQMTEELSLAEILEKHPKGQDFGHIVKKYDRYPFLTDANGEVLSFPPIINSNTLGAVEVGDTDLFIEMTGTDLRTLLLAVSIVACDMSDYGFTILPVKTIYPYNTAFGRELTSPYYFQGSCSATVTQINRMLGAEFTAREAAGYAARMGLDARAAGDTVSAAVPYYRNDFLHPVDLIEDVMIGKGTNLFEPVLPKDFTAGRLSAVEVFARSVKDIMIGLGYQEMVYNYLGSARDFIEKMGIDESAVVRIANPMTENYEYVRNSILPCLLGTESVSANAVYPHKIFEVGKVVYHDPADNQGSVTRNWLGFLDGDSDSNFNDLLSVVSALFFYLSKEYSLLESDDPRFIRGRCADIEYMGRKVGLFGEIHPQVLQNWSVTVPCTACEIDLDALEEE
ncbi:MAG: phenylalanine--tRNA ligase subunit beta [Spirochaetales bacterium]|nr:phenylalanine--tRNA ligase subunit beta [Spirochaetales bacterium]